MYKYCLLHDAAHSHIKNGQLHSHTRCGVRVQMCSSCRECRSHRLMVAPDDLWQTENEESKTSSFRNMHSSAVCSSQLPNHLTACVKILPCMEILGGVVLTGEPNTGSHLYFSPSRNLSSQVCGPDIESTVPIPCFLTCATLY